MAVRIWALLSYVTFFPSLYFALAEEMEHPVRKATDSALWDWLKVLGLWILARIIVWAIWKVFPWEDLAYLPSLTLLLGWIILTVRGLKEFLL